MMLFVYEGIDERRGMSVLLPDQCSVTECHRAAIGQHPRHIEDIVVGCDGRPVAKEKELLRGQIEFVLAKEGAHIITTHTRWCDKEVTNVRKTKERAVLIVDI